MAICGKTKKAQMVTPGLAIYEAFIYSCLSLSAQWEIICDATGDVCFYNFNDNNNRTINPQYSHLISRAHLHAWNSNF